jgi:hypothetical protein
MICLTLINTFVRSTLQISTWTKAGTAYVICAPVGRFFRYTANSIVIEKETTTTDAHVQDFVANVALLLSFLKILAQRARYTLHDMFHALSPRVVAELSVASTNSSPLPPPPPKSQPRTARDTPTPRESSPALSSLSTEVLQHLWNTLNTM